jgi:hypothetical protein
MAARAAATRQIAEAAGMEDAFRLACRYRRVGRMSTINAKCLLNKEKAHSDLPESKVSRGTLCFHCLAEIDR